MKLEEQLDNCVCCETVCDTFCIVEGSVAIDYSPWLPVVATVNYAGNASEKGYCDCYWSIPNISYFNSPEVSVECLNGVVTVSTNQGTATQVVVMSTSGPNPADPRDDCCPVTADSNYETFTFTPSSFTLDGVFIELTGFYFDCSIGGPTTTTTTPPYPTTFPPTGGPSPTTFPPGYFTPTTPPP